MRPEPPKINFAAANPSYQNTLNPPATDPIYPEDYPRPGVYYSLKKDASGTYPGLEASLRGSSVTGKAPPAGRDMDSSKVKNEPGLEAHVNLKTPKEPNDTAPRLNGEDNSCIKFTGFSDVDVCLGNPNKCPLMDPGIASPADGHYGPMKGISMSLWVNIPSQLTQDQNYILDTGGDEFGNPGVSIKVRGSLNGRKDSQQISVLVSTGPKYWKVVLNGMTTSFAWNNIGFRFSENVDRDNVPHGLQVFVNGTSNAWKRTGNPNEVTSVPDIDKSDVKMTVGCKLDGSAATIGKFDNLAAFYWALRDNPGSSTNQDSLFTKTRKDSPFDLDHGHNGQEIHYFMGGREFNTTNSFRDETNPVLRTGRTAPGNIISDIEAQEVHPWNYLYADFKAQEALWNDETFLEVTKAAENGDCEPQNPSTYHNMDHPINCADTYEELRAAVCGAINHQMDFNDNYSGWNLVKALIRVINRNKLSEAQIEGLTGVPLQTMKEKLMEETSTDESTLSFTKEGKFYNWFIWTIGQLQIKQYHEVNRKNMMDDREAGLSYWMGTTDQVLMRVAQKLSSNYIVLQSNNTVSYVSRINRASLTGSGSDILFPDYNLTIPENGTYVPLYDFPNKTSWETAISDYIMLPKAAFEGWTDPSEEVSVVTKLYNDMSKIFPGFLDSRVIGNEDITGKKFFLNSRIISLSLYPAMDNPQALLDNPVKFRLKFAWPQRDLPFRKGGILCAHWVFQNISHDKVGAWDTDGCRLTETDDKYATCECAHLSDYAVLQEDHVPQGRVGDGAYTFCYVLYGIAIVCLLIFITIISTTERLHIELYIIGLNIAVAMLLAIIAYLITMSACKNRVACMIVSVFLHYFYTSTYLWCTLLAHYIFRALTTSRLGGILGYYCVIGWGLPGVLVCVLSAVDVTKYGLGERCLGSHLGYFMWIYVGTFIFFCFCVCPLAIISICNWDREIVKDPEDRADIRWSLIGLLIFWPFIMLVWMMAIFVYLVPQDSMMPDFLFEFFNSLQGIMIFLLLGVLVPTFRNSICFCCAKRRQVDEGGDDWMARKKKMYIQYFD